LVWDVESAVSFLGSHHTRQNRLRKYHRSNNREWDVYLTHDQIYWCCCWRNFQVCCIVLCLYHVWCIVVYDVDCDHVVLSVLYGVCTSCVVMIVFYFLYSRSISNLDRFFFCDLWPHTHHKYMQMLNNSWSSNSSNHHLAFQRMCQGTNNITKEKSGSEVP